MYLKEKFGYIYELRCYMLISAVPSCRDSVYPIKYYYNFIL